MTENEKVKIKSVLNTLTELIYKLMKEKDGLNENQLELLESYEKTLINLIDSI
ncbi:hypothetical protein GOQ04_00020 [Emticicia sp. ODNR4P]|nr:hypothetical protein [Emticicia sp. ODNR4P]